MNEISTNTPTTNMQVTGNSFNSSNVASTSTKVDLVQSPIMFKKLLSMAAFFMAFATVMTLLLIYYDNTALRHHQFKVNMSQDDELLSVAQDNPELIMYIKQMLLETAKETHHKPLESTIIINRDVTHVMKLLNHKVKGVFVEAGAYNDGKFSNTEWLEKNFSWSGLLIQPDPRHYFNLKRHNREKSQAIHACLSPTPYPKEITFHQEERDGVKISSVHPNLIDDPSWFTRVKCFPLYSLLLAINKTRIDFLSLESGGTELQVLETIPFDRVNINIIDVHLHANENEKESIKKFLAKKSYTFVQNFNSSYIFMLKNVSK